MIHLTCIETIDGKIYYRISGEEHPRTIIFVHGLAGDSRFFHNQLKKLSSSYKIIAIDLPGHGRSHKPDKISAEIYSKSIELVTEKEKIKKYIIAGHSMGGAICFEHYINNRHRIEAMILISTSHQIPVTEEMINSSINDFDKFLDTLLSSIYYKRARIFMLAARRQIGFDETTTITEDLKICMKMDYTGILEQIDIPVLVIANRYDEMIPFENTRKMQSLIKNSKLEVFDIYGHIPFFEESELFNNTILKFINSVQ